MKSEKSKNLSQFIFLVLIPIAIGLAVILKSLLIKGCFAFDSNDDVGHTFADYYVIKNILAQGYLPLINLFNNFGMPIPGDVLSYPFSLHGVTYFVFPHHVAMTFNRFFVTALSVSFMTIYFKRYVSLPSASLCAFLVAMTPTVLHSFAHHHYQASLLYAVLLILAQEVMFERKSKIYYFAFFFLLVAAMLSLSYMMVLIIISFLLLNVFFIKPVLIKNFVVLFGLILAMFILTFPETKLFFQQALGSTRVDGGYGYALSLEKMVLGLLGIVQSADHVESDIVFSLPVLALISFGFFNLFDYKQERQLGVKMLFMGVLPCLAAFFFLYRNDIKNMLPLIRSADTMRILWISTIFFMLPLGKAFDYLFHKKFNHQIYFAHLILFFVVLIFHLSYGFQTFIIPILVFFIVWAGYFFLISPKMFIFFNRAKAAIPVIACVLLAMTLIVIKLFSLDAVTGIFHVKECKYGYWYSDQKEKDYYAPSFIDKTKPFSRMAHAIETVKGYDRRIIQYDRLGSHARMPFVHKGFAKYVILNRLAGAHEGDIDGLGNYFFVYPWRARELSELGIRYVVQNSRNPQAEADGWKLLGYEKGTSLYENPEPTSLSYLVDSAGKNYPIADDSIQIKGNGLKIKLPDLQEEMQLVVTFIAREGWKADVDGNHREIFHQENYMLRLRLTPGDKIAWVRFEPFSSFDYLWALIIAGGILFFCLKLYLLPKKEAV